MDQQPTCGNSEAYDKGEAPSKKLNRMDNKFKPKKIPTYYYHYISFFSVNVVSQARRMSERKTAGSPHQSSGSLRLGLIIPSVHFHLRPEAIKEDGSGGSLFTLVSRCSLRSLRGRISARKLVIHNYKNPFMLADILLTHYNMLNWGEWRMSEPKWGRQILK